jgi:CRP/FNR family transcriptional regulator, nitrogen oxide reductase regulator
MTGVMAPPQAAAIIEGKMPERILAAVRALNQVPERPSNAAVIESCTLLNALREDQRRDLIAHSFMAYAERGEAIWTAGQPSEYFAVVGAGFVKMTKSTASGQEVAMELLGPGQAFGLFAAIEGRAFPLAAIAVTNCWYLKIPMRLFLPIYTESNALKDALIRNLGPRLRKAHEMMSRLSSGRVEERVAAVLFILADSYGVRTDEGLQIGVPLTRQDIAEMAGTTVETTIRILSRWQKEGVVCTEKHLITILDEDELEEAVRG